MAKKTEKKQKIEKRKDVIVGKGNSKGDGKRFFKNKWVIAIVLVLIVILATILLKPNEEVIVNVSDRNSNIYSMLVAIGVEEALVDARDERVLVEYELPEGVDKEESWYYIMGVVAGLSQESENLFIQAFVNGEGTEEVQVKVKDVLDFQNVKISLDDFKEKVKIS